MKILIGTPIHACKDYAMERWLKNVAELQKNTSADLFLVDNSPGWEYVERVKGYCTKYGVINYKIGHVEVDQELPPTVRIDRSQLLIGREILSQNYDAWFSWECDQIIPSGSLNELIRIMNSWNFMMVMHNTWWRTEPSFINFGLGCTLIKKECLQLGRIHLLFTRLMRQAADANHWNWLQEFFAGEEFWLEGVLGGDWLQILLREEILQNGNSYVQVEGAIDPVYHLNK